MRRDEADYSSATIGDPHDVWYRFEGRQLGFTGNNGTYESDYTHSIANRIAVAGTAAFMSKSYPQESAT